MKIVDKKTFFKLPEGTIYSKFSNYSFGTVTKKYDTWYDSKAKPIDWIYQEISDFFPSESSRDNMDIFDSMIKTGKSIPLKLDSSSRDGLYEDDQLFAIYDQADIQLMVDFLLNK